MKLILLFVLCFLSLPGIAQEDDEELLKELDGDRKRQVQMALELNKNQEQIKNSASTAAGEFKKLGDITVNAAMLMDEKAVKLVKRMMQENNLSHSTPDLVKELLYKKTKGTYAEAFLRNNPKVTNALVDVMQDEKALPSLLGVFLRKDDLKKYGLIWLCLFFGSWLFKRIFFSKNWGRVKAFFIGILLSLAVSFASLAIFYHMFYEEVSPTSDILVKHWRMNWIKT